jgi:hypothetical protein
MPLYHKSWSDLGAGRRNIAWSVQDSLHDEASSLTGTGNFIAGVFVGFMFSMVLFWLVGVL